MAEKTLEEQIEEAEADTLIGQLNALREAVRALFDQIRRTFRLMN